MQQWNELLWTYTHFINNLTICFDTLHYAKRSIMEAKRLRTYGHLINIKMGYDNIILNLKSTFSKFSNLLKIPPFCYLSPQWRPFCYVFLLMGGGGVELFRHVGAFLLLFSPGPLHESFLSLWRGGGVGLPPTPYKNFWGCDAHAMHAYCILQV